jgi:hypothetical protein
MGEDILKTDHVIVTITKEMVQGFEEIFGKQTKLPPTFPMLFYQYINVPWQYAAAPIHRKQICTCSKELSIGDCFRCTVTLDKEIKKGKYTFYTQTLIGYDLEGSECFQCVSELVVHSQ